MIRPRIRVLTTLMARPGCRVAKCHPGGCVNVRPWGGAWPLPACSVLSLCCCSRLVKPNHSWRSLSLSLSLSNGRFHTHSLSSGLSLPQDGRDQRGGMTRLPLGPPRAGAGSSIHPHQFHTAPRGPRNMARRPLRGGAHSPYAISRGLSPFFSSRSWHEERSLGWGYTLLCRRLISAKRGCQLCACIPANEGSEGDGDGSKIIKVKV